MFPIICHSCQNTFKVASVAELTHCLSCMSEDIDINDHLEVEAGQLSLPVTTNPETVAIIYNDDDSVYDEAFTWETGQNYANQGYRVVPVKDDGTMTIEQQQAMYDSEKAAHDDLFGPGVTSSKKTAAPYTLQIDVNGERKSVTVDADSEDDAVKKIMDMFSGDEDTTVEDNRDGGGNIHGYSSKTIAAIPDGEGHIVWNEAERSASGPFSQADAQQFAGPGDEVLSESDFAQKIPNSATSSIEKVQAKLQEIAAGVIATNPSMTMEAALNVAAKTVTRYPKVAGIK